MHQQLTQYYSLLSGPTCFGTTVPSSRKHVKVIKTITLCLLLVHWAGFEK